MLDYLPEVAADYGMVGPTVVEHQVVAETGVIDDHLHIRLAEVAEGLDLSGFVLGGHDTLGEQRDGILPVETKFVVESYGEAEGEVALAYLQILKSLHLGLELDDVRDAEFLHQHTDEVNIEAFGLSVVVEEGVWPQIPRVLID
jgi:hypothetical protein